MIGKQRKKQMRKNWWMEENSHNMLNILLGVFLKVTHYLPTKFKHKLVYKTGQFILSVTRKIYILIRKKTEIYKLEGMEKYSNKKLILLIASNKETRSFFSKRLFNKIVTEKNLGIFTYKTAHKKIMQQKGSYDLAMIKSDVHYQSFFKKNGYTIMPELISFKKILPKTIDELTIHFSKEMQDEINECLQQNYIYEICSDYRHFVVFYYDMYKPYIQWKHHSIAKIVSFQSIKYLYESGAKILFVKHNNEIIFGGLFIQEKDSIITYYAAFMKDKFDYLEKGVTSLSYYYLMKHALKEKIKAIDFGTASPFINEGIFKFKSKWDMTIVKSSPIVSQIYCYQFKSNSSSIRSFLLHNPFIIYKNKKLIGIFFSQSNQGNELEKKKHINTLKGLSDIYYTTPRDFLE